MTVKKKEIVDAKLQETDKKQGKLVILSLAEPKRFKQAMVCN